MKPLDIQVLGDELAIRWDDGAESFLKLDALRRACPCAGCQGEHDVMGHLHKGPERPLTAASFQLQRVQPIGSYALQPFWGDGHSTGMYTYPYLRRLGGLA
jgi:DUF971 family protein